MGYYMAANTQKMMDLEELESLTELQHIESLQLTDAEKAELELDN